MLVQKNIAGEIAHDKKTGREVKLLNGLCSVCDRKKSMIVSDNTIQSDELDDFFKSLGKKSRCKKNVLKNPGRAFEVGANLSTAFATRKP